MKEYISVIIPIYHDWERLKICIDALSKQTYPKEKFEVIIVNNDPKDSPPELSLPDNFRIISEGKPGSYAARNAGIKVADGEILAFTDSDCIPDEKWLENGVSFLNSIKGGSRVAGRIKLFFRNKKLSLTEIYEKAFAFRQSDYVKRSGAAVTANMFSKKNVFDKVGLFDDELLSGEDINWGIKAQHKGYKIAYCPEVIVKHPARYKFTELHLKAKRVAGGLEDRFKKEKYFNLISLFRGFLPPIFTIPSLLRNQQLNYYEKAVSFFIRYYVKVYKSTLIVMYKIGYGRKERL